MIATSCHKEKAQPNVAIVEYSMICEQKYLEKKHLFEVILKEI